MFSKTSTRPIAVAVVAALLAFAPAPVVDAAAKPRKKITSSKAKARPKAQASAPAPVGATFEARLASLMNSSVAAGSNASLQVVDVETGRVVGERNPYLSVAPASNLKLFTTAAAYDLLPANFEAVTSLDIRGTIDPNGTLDGDVRIVGRGDPTIGSRFHDGKAAAVPEEWARELKRAGVQAVRGSLIFEYGYFDTQYIHPSWPVDQLVNWYEAPVAALSMQEGCVMVRVLPSKPGQRAIVQLEPPNTHVQVENTCVTGGGRGVFVTRQLGTNRIIVKGNVPPRTGATEIYVTVMNPVHYFANTTTLALQRGGIRLLGGVQLVTRDPRNDWRTIAEHKTPLSVIAMVINKKSQNHYAEQLLKIIGAEVKRDGSFEGGAQAIEEWLMKKVGVASGQVDMVDGSGMSRFNRASAGAFTALLRYMWKTPAIHEFVSSMPYSGEPESRLRRRLNQPPYARTVYAKTGYISGVVGLSGYVHAQSGKVYAFSFLFNNYRTGVFGVYQLQDEMLKEIVRSG